MKTPKIDSKAASSLVIRGEAIADLVPSERVRRKDRVEATARHRAFMLADPIRGVEIKRLIEEGRA